MVKEMILRSTIISLVWMRLRVIACVIAAGMYVVPSANGAIIVKIRTSPLPPEASSEEKASTASPRKVAELVVNVSVTFDKIAQMINQFEYRFQAQGAAAAGLVSYKGALTIGKVSLSPSGKAQFPLRAVAPFKLIATISGYPLDVNGEATIDFAADVGHDWCPILKFDEPSVKFTEKVALPADKSIPSLSEFVAAKFLSNELSANLTCDQLRNEIAKFWTPMAVPVMTSNKKLFLKFDPQSLAVSRFAVGTDRVSVSLALGALATIVTHPQTPKKTSLPSVKSISQQSPSNASTEAEATLSLPIGMELR